MVRIVTGPALWFLFAGILGSWEVWSTRSDVITLQADGRPAAASIDYTGDNGTGEDTVVAIVRYDNADVDGEVEVPVTEADLGAVGLPSWVGDSTSSEPGPVGIVYSPVDPYLIAVAGQPAPSAWPAILLAVGSVVGAGAAAVRQLKDRDTLIRLAGEAHGAVPRLRMMGVLRRSRFSRRTRLVLYPFNTQPGGPPTVSVELADRTIVGETERGFPVTVSGLPRPGGLLVPSADGRLLWPAGRASLSARGGFPPPDPGHSTIVVRRETDRGNPRTWFFGVVAAFLALFVMSSLGDYWVDREFLAAATPAVVTVTEASPNAGSITVQTVDVDGSTDDGLTTLVRPSQEYRVGQRYPAHFNLDRSEVRLDKEVQSPVEGIAFTVLLVVAVGAWAARRSWL